MRFCLSLMAVLVFSVTSFAEVSFTLDEMQRHQMNLRVIVEEASRCLDQTYESHLDFYERWGVSKYYGNRNKSLNTREKRLSALASYGAPLYLIEDLEPTSCIGLAMKCLSQGFSYAGMQSTWDKIYSELSIDNKFYGTDLQKILRKLGWKVMYWNPAPEFNSKWDEQDKRDNPLKAGTQWNPVWGGHAYRYHTVMNKGHYYGVPVDDAETLVGFGRRPPSSFSRIPFFIGTAHAGYHVFPGRGGDVIEAHSTKKLNDIKNMEFSVFNPLENGGGPRWLGSARYRSGLIVVPNL